MITSDMGSDLLSLNLVQSAALLHAIKTKMREAYIVKKSVKRSPLQPKELVSREEYEKLVDESEKLIWYEHTKHGKRLIEREPNRFKYKMRAYINYDENDESTWASMLPPFSGFISIQFDY